MSGALDVRLFGGYKKMQVLQYVDRLTNEIMALEIALQKKKNGESYTLPPETAPCKLKKCLLGGFSCKDVDLYIEDMRNKCRELREKL